MLDVKLESEPFQPLANPIDLHYDNQLAMARQMPERTIALTFDDGPSSEYTPQILNILKQHQVKATFFLVGQRIQECGDLVKRIHNEGHEIGNHTFQHDFLVWENGSRERTFLETEIVSTQQALGNCVPIVPCWFRAPYGIQDETILEVAHSLGLHTALWTLDTNDWREVSTAQAIANVALTSSGQDVILLHDGSSDPHQPPEATASRQNTVDALPTIIQGFKDRDCTFVTMSEAFLENKAG